MIDSERSPRWNNWRRWGRAALALAHRVQQREDGHLGTGREQRHIVHGDAPAVGVGQQLQQLGVEQAEVVGSKLAELADRRRVDPAAVLLRAALDPAAELGGTGLLVAAHVAATGRQLSTRAGSIWSSTNTSAVLGGKSWSSAVSSATGPPSSGGLSSDLLGA